MSSSSGDGRLFRYDCDAQWSPSRLIKTAVDGAVVEAISFTALQVPSNKTLILMLYLATRRGYEQTCFQVVSGNASCALSSRADGRPLASAVSQKCIFCLVSRRLTSCIFQGM